MQPRKADRLRTACRVGVGAVGAWFKPGRAPERCSVPSVIPDALFVRPDAPPEEITELRLPNALLLSNQDFQLTCQDLDSGPYGDSVLITTGTVERLVAWTDVTSVQDIELDFLARLSDADIQSIVSPAQDLEGMQRLTRLNHLQAAELLALLAAVRQEIEQDTLLAAEALIRCVWRSTAQTARCASAAAAQTQDPGAQEAGILNPYTVEFGRYDSDTSQEDANQQALLEAQRRLVCLVSNEEQLVTCLSAGYGDSVPNDPEGVTFDGRRRVGSVTVQAGSFFAPSQGQANQQAVSYGTGLLECFYLNQQQVARCQDLDPALATAWNSPVLLTDKQQGNPVTALAGTVVVDAAGASQQDADDLAMLEAQAYLSCRFRNARAEVRCPSLEQGGSVYPPADPDEVFVVEAGTVEGASQEEADRLARDLGLLQLGCQYCNAFIPPSCYPPDYTPAPGKAIPLADVTSAWSPDVILGLEAGVVCDQDAEQMIATSTAISISRPVVVDTGCQYLNDEMWFGCLLDLPGAALPPGGYHHPDYTGNASLPEGYEGTPFAQQLSPASTLVPVIIQAGAYPVYSNEVPPGVSPKQYANQQARLFGLATLYCAFGNPEMTLNCATANGGAFVQNEVAKDDRQVVEVTIPAYRHESFFSFREAVEAARAEARSTLDCYYENPEIHVRCWPGFGSETPAITSGDINSTLVYGTGQARRYWSVGSQVFQEDKMLQPWQPGSMALPSVVPRGTFRSNTSKEDALADALRYSLASLDCTAQAQDNNVCNDPMLMFCGGRVVRNPAEPFTAGEGRFTDKWQVNPAGVTVAGDGHNYVTTRAAGGVLDLGCASDPVAGCGGSGLQVPSCLVTAPTQEEANRLAYTLMEAQLDCWLEDASSVSAQDGADGSDGSDGGDGSDAPQTGCTGKCLAVYS